MFKKIKKILSQKNKRGIEEKSIDRIELEKLELEGAILLDVRSPQEFEEGHLEHAILLPEYEFNQQKVEKLLKNKKETIVVYCATGQRSKKAQKELIQMGYEKVYNLENGLENYCGF